MSQQDSGECNICKGAPFERNNYFPGKVLHPDDFRTEQQYFSKKRWLINRAVLGWGIVCGLDAHMEGGCLVVNPGLALDCCGRELLVCDSTKIDGGKVARDLGVGPNDKAEWMWWALCLEYQECRSAPVKVPHSCGEQGGEGEHNRIRDDCRLTIRPWKDVCLEDHNDDCCPYEGVGRKSSIHKAVEAKARDCPHCKECDCVLVTVGTLNKEPGQDPQIALYQDDWKYRRIVYTNSALAALIRCFHGGLPHIVWMNWKPGDHYDVDVFLDRLRQEHLKVMFDQPMNELTVTNVRTCRLSIFMSPDEKGCPVPILIPVGRIEYSNCTAVYYFDDACIEQKLRALCKKLTTAAEVELVLHGSMIHNKRGHALDAELIHDFPTGNGVEGGEFITYFTVGP